MIISHKFETVFVKTRKTAGTSIEFGLAAVCGPDDVITQVPTEEEARLAFAGRSKQNDDVTWRTLTPKWAATWLLYRRRPRLVREHSPAVRVRKVFGEQLWVDYFTWTVERNPWDKAVSRYFWEASRGAVPTFSEYLRSAPRNMLSCFDLYSHQGEIIVDRVLRFERLSEELPEVWARLGVHPPALPRMKGGHRPEDARDYRTMYSDADAEFIAEVCARELAAFGYRFDP